MDLCTKEYYNLVKKLKEEKDTIFVPFQLKKNNDMFYNKTSSFMIEAIDQLENILIFLMNLYLRLMIALC